MRLWFCAYCLGLTVSLGFGICPSKPKNPVPGGAAAAYEAGRRQASMDAGVEALSEAFGA